MTQMGQLAIDGNAESRGEFVETFTSESSPYCNQQNIFCMKTLQAIERETSCFSNVRPLTPLHNLPPHLRYSPCIWQKLMDVLIRVLQCFLDSFTTLTVIKKYKLAYWADITEISMWKKIIDKFFKRVECPNRMYLPSFDEQQWPLTLQYSKKGTGWCTQ